MSTIAIKQVAPDVYRLVGHWKAELLAERDGLYFDGPREDWLELAAAIEQGWAELVTSSVALSPLSVAPGMAPASMSLLIGVQVGHRNHPGFVALLGDEGLRFAQTISEALEGG